MRTALHRVLALPDDLVIRRPLVPVVLGATDLALGLILLLEPDSRVTGPAFRIARMAPGGMATWGVVILIIGALVVTRTALDLHAGYALTVGGAWHCFFAGALVAAAVQSSKFALAGIVAYISLMLLHFLAAWRKVR
jgi:hypothetical protein